MPNISGEEIKKPYRLEQIIRIKEDNPLDLADFVSKATIKVPETTFNNMHGRLEDVSTEDGKIFAAKAGTMGKYFFQKLFCDITDFKKENLFWPIIFSFRHYRKSKDEHEWKLDPHRCIWIRLGISK